uniref:Uncharacterized protein n=1 Tax=Triticum urartu TaxID=4572 RepID=A0A8R7PEX9_TRIUA
MCFGTALHQPLPRCIHSPCYHGTKKQDLGESLRGELYLTSTRPPLGSRRPRHWSASPSLRPAVLLGHRRTVPHPQTLVLLN